MEARMSRVTKVESGHFIKIELLYLTKLVPQISTDRNNKQNLDVLSETHNVIDSAPVGVQH